MDARIPNNFSFDSDEAVRFEEAVNARLDGLATVEIMLDCTGVAPSTGDVDVDDAVSDAVNYVWERWC